MIANMRNSEKEWTGATATLQVVQQGTSTRGEIANILVHKFVTVFIALSYVTKFMDIALFRGKIGVLTLSLTDMLSGYLSMNLCLISLSFPMPIFEDSREVLTLSLTVMLSGYLSISQSAMSL